VASDITAAATTAAFTANIRKSAHAPDIRPACSQFFSWCEQRGLTLVAIRR
jgi:hypothetical protein